MLHGGAQEAVPCELLDPLRVLGLLPGQHGEDGAEALTLRLLRHLFVQPLGTALGLQKVLQDGVAGGAHPQPTAARARVAPKGGTGAERENPR